MKKIPTIFKRNPENMRELLNEPRPDCQWVFDGEGVATKKYDGTCVKIQDGEYFKRREVKKGKTIPPEFIEEQFDKNTGKRVGWMPVTDKPEDKYHMEAFSNRLPDGTYELLGPKIQGNPEDLERHWLMPHAKAVVFNGVPRSYEGIKKYIQDMDIEGIVFHHKDGRMAKIKKRDFGLKRK